MFVEALALSCITWYIFIAFVCAIGYFQLFIHYRSTPSRPAILSKSKDDVPHVTAIRPCKGLEPYLYECLSATLQQDYPRSKLSVHFCVSSKQDPAYPTIQKVLSDHPNHDGRLFIEVEDPNLLSGHLGPNPKIRNMSRAYREAKGDIIWIIDCNVWINPGACGRMVDTLCGYTQTAKRKRPYKLVHHLPLAIAVPNTSLRPASPLLVGNASGHVYDGHTPTPSFSTISRGSLLEELFFSSSHAKFYMAINTVSIAPCIVGKSTMFRRSQLDSLTRDSGIDFFSHNICEDHLIGDLLWKARLPSDKGLKLKNHGIVLGDFAIQPVAGMTVGAYIARRVRWLRVRKFTVPAATLVEPGTESLVCSAMGSWGLTSSQTVRAVLGWEGKIGNWKEMTLLFLGSVMLWALTDRTVNLLLHSGATVETTSPTTQHKSSSSTLDGTKKFFVPDFARAPPPSSQQARRSWLPIPSPLLHRPRRDYTTWLLAWLGRELLAFPIWAWAIWGGVSVVWRDKRFWVGWDMKVHEIFDKTSTQAEVSGEGMKKSVSSGGVHDGEKHDARNQAALENGNILRGVNGHVGVTASTTKRTNHHRSESEDANLTRRKGLRQ